MVDPASKLFDMYPDT